MFLGIEDDDYLALACMKCLAGKGHDDKLVQYCARRIGKDAYYSEQLKKVLALIEGSKTPRPEPDAPTGRK
jgi:hypothetical protein